MKQMMYLKLTKCFFLMALWMLGISVSTYANTYFTKPIEEKKETPKNSIASLIGEDNTLDLSKGTLGSYTLDGYDIYFEGEELKARALPVVDFWEPVGGISNGSVNSMVSDGSGNVYVGGGFEDAGGIAAADFIAKWDGTSWSALGNGLNYYVNSLVFDASGMLYVGGEFEDAGGIADADRIAKWDGSNWSAVGSGISYNGGLGNNAVNSLVFDASGVLYVGGEFENAGGIADADRIAKWDGSNWSALGSGIDNKSVTSMVFDLSGNLYVGGDFNDAGGIADADMIVKWDGSWSALGSGLISTVHSMGIDASGSVYVGGLFQNAGGVADADYIAKWNGTSWSAVGGGLSSTVYSIFFDGSGNLYVGGSFENAGGISKADGIAKWDGTSWSALGEGFRYHALWTIVIDASGSMYVGGSNGSHIYRLNVNDNSEPIGDGAMARITTGDGNTGVGEDALNKTTTGDNNSAYGAFSLSNNIAGNDNTAIGYRAGLNNEGNGNIFLGHEAGKQQTTASNKLFLDNSDTNTPLLYGEFDNDLLRVNGTLDLATHKITNVVDPTTDQDAATKKYVDAAVAGAGGGGGSTPNLASVLSQGAAAGGAKITGLADPTTDQDATTKKYVDAAVASGSTPGASGSNNTGVGVGVLVNVTTGVQNSGVGNGALANTTTGSYNTAYGVNALHANTTGSLNAAFGRDALLENISGNNNAAIGNRSLKKNSIGKSNSAIGNYSMEGNRTGNYNTAIGFESLRLSKTGSYNIAVGYRAMYNNDGGGFNAAIGYGALKDNVTGTKLTAIGNGADVTMPNLVNAMAIGSNAKVAASSSIRLGNPSVSNIEGQVNFTAVSDRKFKTNIEKSTLGLEFIQQLNPVTYNMQEHGDIQYTGFIAQEVDELVREMGREWSGVKRPANATDHFGLRYAEFTVPLVKATQEQQQFIETLEKENEEQTNKIDELEMKNEELETKNEELENRLDCIEKLLFQKASTTQKLELTLQGNSKQAELLQNIPNPFVSNTLVKAFIPQDVQNARLVITDIHGKVLLEEVIAARGAINTTINAKNLAQGNYIYSLILDDKLLASKTMVLTK